MALLDYNSIFGLSEEQAPDAETGERIVMMPIGRIHEKDGHSFDVRDDIKMAELVESIKRVGVLQPCIVYKRPDGEYELNAGHRRRRASELAGLTEVPVIIREKGQNAMDIEEVDTNIYRGEPSPMEKARAYQKRLKAIEAERKEAKEGYAGARSDQILAKEAEESRNQINRYLRLNYLIEPLQLLADQKKLQLIPAVEISFIRSDEQEVLAQFIEKTGKIPSLKQAARLKEYSKRGELNAAVMELIMDDREKGLKVMLNNQTLSHYFPPDYGQAAMEKVIIELLEQWKQRESM